MKIRVSLALLAIVGGLTFVATPVAQADTGFAVPTLTVTPTSGNVTTDVYFLTSIAVNTAPPAGYTGSGATYVFQNNINAGRVALVRTASTPTTLGTFGLDGAPAFADRSVVTANGYVSNVLLNSPGVSLVSGDFELRYYWSASITAPDPDTDPYLALPMNYNATSGAWSVLPPAIDTTVSLTASASASTVTLDAAIKNATTGVVDPAATGTVTFIKDSAVVVGTATVVAGHSILALPGVADGPYSYTADFTPDNFYAYVGSSSDPATVTVGGNTSGYNITTTIPSGVGTLTLTGVSTTVALGTATLSGGTLNASGTLNAVVTDTRQLDYPAWSLTGQVGNFIAGSKTLDGKYLGWTPAVSGTAGSVAGAVVLPAAGSVNGLKTISTLATGAPSNNGTVTNASALLQLKAPSNTPAGAYSATLTLTLI